MDFLLGILFAPWALIIYVLLAIVFEHKEYTGMAIFLGGLIVLGISPWGVSESIMFSWATLAKGAAIYLPIGVFWSVWRFRKHCSKILAKVAAGTMDKNRAHGRLLAGNNLDTITMWVIVWPFSMVESIIGDIMDGVEVLVRKVFRGTYNRIANNAISKLDKM